MPLPNVPLIYYGDEIGMSYERLKNKDGGYCRTGARTPMQWNAGKNAGFSDGDGEMYLPIYDDYKEINVDTQLKEEDSLINEVQKLVEIKRTYPELFGCGNEFELISDTYPLVFKRTTGEESLLCAVNPSERECTVDIKTGEVLASSNAEITENKITLKPISYIWMKC